MVDDGSEDGTWEWLTKQDGLVTLRQENSGKDYAVNRAFALARGEYVRFLDSDDLLPENCNVLQYTMAQQHTADIVVAGYTAWYERDGASHTRPWVHCDDFIAQQLGECDSSHYSAYLFRRSFLAGSLHRPEYFPRDDRMFIIEAAIKGPKVVAVKQPCLIHRHHLKERVQFPTGLHASATNWQDLQMYRKATKMLSDRGELSPRRRKAIAKSLWPLAHRIAATHVNEACGVVRWIYELDPAFTIPHDRLVDELSRVVGFRMAQYPINAARSVRNFMRMTLGTTKPYSPPRPRGN